MAEFSGSMGKRSLANPGMKIPRPLADIPGDMRQTGQRSPSTSRSDTARSLIAAQDTARVAGWVDALVRAIEARRAHPRDDSALHKIHSDLEEATRSCLNQIGDFTIRVDEFDLFFEGECVYHSTAESGSLSVPLFRGGLRTITLRSGLEPDELRLFLDIVARATAGDQDSEDVVTLLWVETFRHIDYESAPFEEWNTESWMAEGEAGSDRSDFAEGRSDDWSLPMDGEAVSDQPLPEVSTITEIEARNIYMLASIEDALSPRDRILEILWALLGAEERPAEFLEIALSLGRLIEHAVATGEMEEASKMVDRLRGISDSKATTPSEFQSATSQVLQRIGREDFLGRLGAILGRNRDLDLDALKTFLAQLGPSAAPTLCDVLGKIEEAKIRRVICDALVISCKSHISILIDRLSDPRWYVVRNILYILGRIAHQGVERALGDALTHSDVRVRKEALRALGGIDSPASRAYLNSMLRDPDKDIRILVAQLLAGRKDERAARILWSVIESPEFVGRDLDERVAFCGALARTDSDSLIPKVERMLTRGGIFQQAVQGGRMEAAMVLAWLGTPAALDVLSREAKSRNDSVRRAVKEALETVREFAAKDRQKG